VLIYRPSAKPQPAEMNPEGPLIPAWPDVRPVNAWCLPQTIFVPHIDRVLATLGLPVESRTSMITAWLPGITRHKNIVCLRFSIPAQVFLGRADQKAYRILGPDQLNPTTTLTMIPPPDVLIRLMVCSPTINI
jgi:hypothetical protein